MGALSKQDLLKEVGLRIRARRETLNLSQAELGERIGLRQANIAAYEAGEVDIPLSRLILIATALRTGVIKIIPGQLFSNDDEDEQDVVNAMNNVLKAVTGLSLVLDERDAKRTRALRGVTENTPKDEDGSISPAPTGSRQNRRKSGATKTMKDESPETQETQ